MSKPLAVIAIVGFTLCAACLSLAYALDGSEFGFDSFEDFAGSKPLAVTATSKIWAWEGGDSVEIDVPATVHVEPGGAPRVTVHGPEYLVRRVQMGGGRIAFDHSMSFMRSGNLDVTLSGIALKSYALHGSGKLLLGRLDQDTLDVAIAGSGGVSAGGKVGRLKLHIAGSGRADLGQLAVESVSLHIAGSGNAALAPADAASITIAGSGTVRLVTQPKKLEMHIAGSGRILGPSDDIGL